MDAPKQDPQDKDAERLRDLLRALRAYVEGGCSQRLWGPVAEAMKPWDDTAELMERVVRRYGSGGAKSRFLKKLDHVNTLQTGMGQVDPLRYSGPYAWLVEGESVALLKSCLLRMEAEHNLVDPEALASLSDGQRDAYLADRLAREKGGCKTYKQVWDCLQKIPHNYSLPKEQGAFARQVRRAKKRLTKGAAPGQSVIQAKHLDPTDHRKLTHAAR